jgi:hypothetical protein
MVVVYISRDTQLISFTFSGMHHRAEDHLIPAKRNATGET